MHAVNIDDANIATRRAHERAAAENAGYQIIGIGITELRPGDRLVTGTTFTDGMPPVVRSACPCFGADAGRWVVNLWSAKPVKTDLRRVSIWRALDARAA